jgi:hypothetical protein
VDQVLVADSEVALIDFAADENLVEEENCCYYFHKNFVDY